MRYLRTLLMLLAPSVLGASVSFDAEIQRWSVTNNTATTTWTLTSSVAAGKYMLLPLGWETSGNVLTNVVDSRGNVWSIHQQRRVSTVHNSAIAGAYALTALSPGDTITLGWSNAATCNQVGTLLTFNNAATNQPSTGGQTNRFGSAVSFSVSTITTNCLAFNILTFEQDATYGSSLWTEITPRQEFGHSGSTVGLVNYMLYTNAVASGAACNPGGTISTNKTYLALTTILSSSTASPTNTYYVDFGSGSDANSGLATNTAWKHAPGDTNATGVAASTLLVAGDRLFFRGGVEYNGRIQVNQSGTSVSPILFDGESWGGTALLNLQSNWYNGFSGTSSYITVTGFDIYNAKNNANDVNVTIDRGGVTVSNVTYNGTGAPTNYGAIYIGGTGWLVKNNRIHDFENWSDRSVQGAETDGNTNTISSVPLDQTGINIVSTASSTIVSNNVIWATGRDAIRFGTSSNFIAAANNFGGDSSVTNKGWFAVAIRVNGYAASIKDNTFHEGWQYQGDDALQRSHAGDWLHIYGDNDGVLEITDPHDIIIERNKFYNDHIFASSAGTAYSLIEDDVYDVTARNNLVLNDFAGGFEMQAVSNIFYYNNTFVTWAHGNNSGGAPIYLSNGGLFDPINITIIGNLIYRQDTNSAQQPFGTSNAYTGAYPTCDYNLYYSPNNGNNWVRWSNTNYTLAAWQALTGQDSHSIYARPSFVSFPKATDVTSSGDFKIYRNSNGAGQGIDLSYMFTTDITGQTRTLPWDIGAYINDKVKLDVITARVGRILKAN